MNAVRKGTTAVGVRGKDVIVLGVEKKSTAKLQDSRTVRKIHKLDNHVCLAFAGLTADARVLVNKARLECQNYRLTVEDAPSVDYITRYIAGVQQKYTQSGGVRPFGISTLVVGFDSDGTPHLFQTDPAGTYSAWKANATGRNAKTVREYLEKSYEAEASAEDNIKLTLKALMEVVESKSKTIEIAVLEHNKGLRYLTDEEVDGYLAQIEETRAAEEEAAKEE